MKFNINDYKGNYVMHCKTEEEAIDFCSYLHSIGRTWYHDSSYKSNILWKKYGKDTIYYFNDGVFGDKKRIIHNKFYTILEWSDFMNKEFTKRNLKTGDVIQRRNGIVEIVNCELEMFISKTGWNNFDNIRNDLTSILDSKFDIVKVRRPKEKSDCQFCAIEMDFGELVYERKEVEEMTLAEVCQLLGKEIKIIK